MKSDEIGDTSSNSEVGQNPNAAAAGRSPSVSGISVKSKPPEVPGREHSSFIQFTATAALVVLTLLPGLHELAKLNEEQFSFIKSAGLSSTQFISTNCDLKPICKHYSEVRLSCAEAGSIDRCIEIKMEGEPYRKCSEDGHVAFLPEKVRPSVFQCLAVNIGYISDLP